MFNGERTIINTLTGVLGQSYTSFEIIIVDDGSDNPVEQFIALYLKDDRIRVFRTAHSNANVARNYGIMKCRGEYIAMLDADDCWLENHLRDCLALLQESGADGLYGSIFLRNSLSGSIQSLRAFQAREPMDGETVIDYLLTTSCGAQTSTLFTTARSMKDILWNPELFSHQDYDFVVRYCKKYRMAVRKEPTVVYYLSSGRIPRYESCIRFINDNMKDIDPAVYVKYNLNMYIRTGQQEKSKKFALYYLNEASVYLDLETVVGVLYRRASAIYSTGLLHGLTGVAIFFFHYARYIQNTEYEDFAKRIMETVQHKLAENYRLDYSSGIAGIGAGIEYLIKNNFLEGNSDEILEDFDQMLSQYIICEEHTDGNILYGIGRYFIARINNSEPFDANKQAFNTMMLIHIVDILNDMPLTSTELSGLYDLILLIDKLSIYPAKVQRLLKRIKHENPDLGEQKVFDFHQRKTTEIHRGTHEQSGSMIDEQLERLNPGLYGLSGIGLHLIDRKDGKHTNWYNLL